MWQQAGGCCCHPGQRLQRADRQDGTVESSATSTTRQVLNNFIAGREQPAGEGVPSFIWRRAITAGGLPRSELRRACASVPQLHSEKCLIKDGAHAMRDSKLGGWLVTSTCFLGRYNHSPSNILEMLGSYLTHTTLTSQGKYPFQLYLYSYPLLGITQLAYTNVWSHASVEVSLNCLTKAKEITSLHCSRTPKRSNNSLYMSIRWLNKHYGNKARDEIARK